MLHAMSIWLQKRGGLIIHCAGRGLRLQVEGIVAGEAHFHESSTALHGVETGADEFPVEENVARRGHEIDVVQLGLKNLCISADGAEIQLTGALPADQ